MPALFKHLSKSVRASISLAELEASYVEVSVQPDRTVVHLWFSDLPTPFGREAVLTTLERIRTQLLTGAFSTEEFSVLSRRNRPCP